MTELALTTAGSAVGTVSYMSPEQARGEQLDTRTDLFSFGVVLYEMLTGKEAFTGSTTAVIFHAILANSPPSVLSLNPALPPKADEIVRKTLEKESDLRCQTAAELRADLKRLKRDSDSARSAAGSSASQPVVATAPRKRGKLLAFSLVGLCAAAMLFAGGWYTGKGRSEEPPLYRQLTFRRGTVRNARFAPDGKTIVYSAAWEGRPARDLLEERGRPRVARAGVQRCGPGRDRIHGRDGDQRQLPSRRHVHRHGHAVARAAGRRRSARGARRRAVGRLVTRWHQPRRRPQRERPDQARVPDRQVAVRDRRVGEPSARVARRHDGGVRRSPVAGRRRRIDLGGGRDREEARPDQGWYSVQGLAWANKTEVWFTGTKTGVARALFAISLAGAERLVARIPGTLTLHDVSPNGLVLLARDTWRRELMGMRADDAKERNLSWQDYSYPAELSDDGQTLLFDEEGEAGGFNYAVFIRKTDGSAAVKLGPALAVALSPDGKWVISQTTTAPSQLVLLPTGPGDAKPLTHDSLTHAWAHWLPDGRQLVFAGSEEGKGNRFYLMSIDGGAPKPISGDGVDALQFAVSNDGHMLAGIGPDGHGYLYPIAGGDPRRIAGFEDGEVPINWTVGRQGPVRHEARRSARAHHAARRDDRAAHDVEGADAARQRGRAEHRPHPDHPGRQDLRLRLPAPPVGSLPGGRTEVERER